MRVVRMSCATGCSAWSVKDNLLVPRTGRCQNSSSVDIETRQQDKPVADFATKVKIPPPSKKRNRSGAKFAGKKRKFSDISYMPGSCGQCGQRARNKCGGCGIAWFCDRKCQRSAWGDHKVSCRPKEATQPREPRYKRGRIDRPLQGLVEIPEIMSLIFSFLPIQTHLTHLFRVNKAVRETLLKDPTAWPEVWNLSFTVKLGWRARPGAEKFCHESNLQLPG
eukprot:g40340.t1